MSNKLQIKRIASSDKRAFGTVQPRHSRGLLPRTPSIQPKNAISQPDDEYEREADRIANLVMRMTEPRQRYQFESGKKENHPILEPLPHSWPNYLVGPELEFQFGSLKSGGQALPQSERSFFEPRFGYDFSHVRVHADVTADNFGHELNAEAFTIGQDIYFRRNRWTGGYSNREVLAHELTHVVQQKGGEPYSKFARTPSRCCDKEGEPQQVSQDVQKEKLGWKEGMTIKPTICRQVHKPIKIIKIETGSIEDLIDRIVKVKMAILTGYYGALDNFETVWKAARDKEGVAQIGATVIGHVNDMIIGGAESEATGRIVFPAKGVLEILPLVGLYNDVKKEVERAKKARESAEVRDFIVSCRSRITIAEQRLWLAWAREDDQDTKDEYKALSPEQRTWLIADLGVQLSLLRARVKTPGEYFRLLSERWVQEAKMKLAIYGHEIQAFVSIELDKDWKVTKAHIYAPGGERIATQLVKDAVESAGAEGVDLDTLRMPQYVCYTDQSGSKHCGEFDAEGKGIIYDNVLKQRIEQEGGLPATKLLSGE